MTPKSPIIGGGEVRLVKSIDKNIIIEGYRNTILNIDVEPYFKGIEKINLYECIRTGYKFFYPFNIDGNSIFYESLQLVPNYYPRDKWEFNFVADQLPSLISVLEIGCGNGAFLEKIKDRCNVVGLELNENVKAEVIRKGIDVKFETIQEHVNNNPNKYDVVCSFQVLEHISEVLSFIESSLKALKPKGKLIIAVPNTESLVFSSEIILERNQELQQLTFLLNCPPHHMGHWNSNSLRSIKEIYSLKDIKIYYEPMPKFRVPMINEIISKKLSFPLNIICNMFPKLFLGKQYTGDTIIAIYSK